MARGLFGDSSDLRRGIAIGFNIARRRIRSGLGVPPIRRPAPPAPPAPPDPPVRYIQPVDVVIRRPASPPPERVRYVQPMDIVVRRPAPPPPAPAGRSAMNKEPEDKQQWFFNKYKDTYYDDYLYVMGKIKELHNKKINMSSNEYKKLVHIDFPNNQVATEFLEDLHFSHPRDYELITKNLKKTMVHNRKAEKRYLADTRKR